MTKTVLDQIRSECPYLLETPLCRLGDHGDSESHFGSSFAIFHADKFSVRFGIDRSERDTSVAPMIERTFWWELGWVLRIAPPVPWKWNLSAASRSSVANDVKVIIDNYEMISVLMSNRYIDLARPQLESMGSEQLKMLMELQNKIQNNKKPK